METEVKFYVGTSVFYTMNNDLELLIVSRIKYRKTNLNKYCIYNYYIRHPKISGPIPYQYKRHWSLFYLHIYTFYVISRIILWFELSFSKLCDKWNHYLFNYCSPFFEFFLLQHFWDHKSTVVVLFLKTSSIIFPNMNRLKQSHNSLNFMFMTILA